MISVKVYAKVLIYIPNTKMRSNPQRVSHGSHDVQIYRRTKQDRMTKSNFSAFDCTGLITCIYLDNAW